MRCAEGESRLYAQETTRENVFLFDLKNASVGGTIAGPFHGFLLFSYHQLVYTQIAWPYDPG